MKTAIILSILTATTLLPAQKAEIDGNNLSAEEIEKIWGSEPKTPTQQPSEAPKKPTTRGWSQEPAPVPAAIPIATRQIVLSSDIQKANSTAMDNLRTRGMVKHSGQAAIDAQQRQDNQTATPATDLTNTPDALRPVTIQLAVNPEQQVAFRLNFKKNSTEFADTASSHRIDVIAQAMQAFPDKIFLLEGHTCDLGREAYNLTLSEKRALQVRHLLAQKNISPERLIAIGQGESQFAYPNTSETNRALNRRVVIGPMELLATP